MNKKRYYIIGVIFVCVLVLVNFISYSKFFRIDYQSGLAEVKTKIQETKIIPLYPPLDKSLYSKKMMELANYPVLKVSTTTASTTKPIIHPWPTKTIYPNDGAILPFKRIIAYYGNFYSKGMGVLGEYPKDEMLAKLKVETDKWNAADPNTPVLPAIDYIVLTAQGSPGKEGKYMLRMPDDQIDHALELAHAVNGIVILDVQVGLSTLEHELPMLEKYLKMPEVHLAIDPEFSMKTGARPGTVIGTFDAQDINYAANYLATLVKQNNLPPKVLIVHRFTEDMVTNYKLIKPLPEAQIVMDMDGWGFAAKKLNTYQQVIFSEPVQFTGFKLFYKNDLIPPSTRILTPEELLKLIPRPSFIQFQ